MLKWKKSRYFYAKKLGVSEKEIGKLIRQAKELQKVKQISLRKETRKEDLVKGTIESIKTVKFEPSSHQELAIIHNVDLEKFIITNYWSKLQPNGDFTSSIFCRRKQSKDYSLEDFAKFLKGYKPNYTQESSLPKDKNKEEVDMEMSIADYHLAKKYVTKDNSINARCEAFFDIAKRLAVKTAMIYNINKIVFPISNDFFHTDNYFNTTTKGTPQDVIAEYDEEYEKGFDVLVRTILMLRNVSEHVTIVLVQGNHDRTKSFYLAHALEVFFRDNKNISFLRESTPTKFVTLGNTFIGYHHGNCKIDELPLVFATGPKSASQFGEAKFREVHTGDKHHYMAKEIKGVRIQQMPSLSGDDKWHRDHNFVNNVRAALVLLYDKDKGKCGEFEERL
jgi:hypothetical protein